MAISKGINIWCPFQNSGLFFTNVLSSNVNDIKNINIQQTSEAYPVCYQCRIDPQQPQPRNYLHRSLAQNYYYNPAGFDDPWKLSGCSKNCQSFYCSIFSRCCMLPGKEAINRGHINVSYASEMHELAIQFLPWSCRLYLNVRAHATMYEWLFFCILKLRCNKIFCLQRK